MSLDLEAIRALCNAATPGPWTWHRGVNDMHFGYCADDCGVDYAPGHAEIGTYGFTPGNAEFIAWCREGVPALVAEVERLTAEREALAAAVREHKAAHDAAVSEGIRSPDFPPLHTPPSTGAPQRRTSSDPQPPSSMVKP